MSEVILYELFFLINGIIFKNAGDNQSDTVASILQYKTCIILDTDCLHDSRSLFRNLSQKRYPEFLDILLS